MDLSICNWGTSFLADNCLGHIVMRNPLVIYSWNIPYVFATSLKAVDGLAWHSASYTRKLKPSFLLFACSTCSSLLSISCQIVYMFIVFIYILLGRHCIYSAEQYWRLSWRITSNTFQTPVMWACILHLTMGKRLQSLLDPSSLQMPICCHAQHKLNRNKNFSIKLKGLTLHLWI